MAGVPYQTDKVADALGDEDSAKDDSFSNGLLEYPQYTRPAVFKTMDGKELKVPEVLLSGDHNEIKKWREENRVVSL